MNVGPAAHGRVTQYARRLEWRVADGGWCWCVRAWLGVVTLNMPEPPDRRPVPACGVRHMYFEYLRQQDLRR
eukprot:2521689-Prymnesium_polylepis.1